MYVDVMDAYLIVSIEAEDGKCDENERHENNYTADEHEREQTKPTTQVELASSPAATANSDSKQQSSGVLKKTTQRREYRTIAPMAAVTEASPPHARHYRGMVAVRRKDREMNERRENREIREVESEREEQ